MADHKPVIGLLGAPGSGKSMVARQMKELGAAVIDADAIAQAQLDIPEIRDQIVAWWGRSMLNPDGRIDRAAVARIVFDDPEKLDRLEALIHPRVRVERDRLRSEYQRDPSVKAIVEDVALLLESGSADGCDVLVFVDADRSERLARVRRSRGWSDADLAAREKNQWPLDRKRARADYVIRNDRGEAECFTQVRQVLSRVIHERA